MYSNATESSQDGTQPVKDDKYFFDDGDCLFLVEGILFKVLSSYKGSIWDPESIGCFTHHFLGPNLTPNFDRNLAKLNSKLGRDVNALLVVQLRSCQLRHSFTKDVIKMPSAPRGDRNLTSCDLEVGSQDMVVLDPIPLSDDSSAEEFRALCWAVYALPNEIHGETTRGATDVKRLLDVAKMCHKYSLPAFESWALERIRIECRSPVDHLARCTQEMLGQIMGLASLCRNDKLLALVEGAWILRLQSRGSPMLERASRQLTAVLHCSLARYIIDGIFKAPRIMSSTKKFPPGHPLSPGQGAGSLISN
ncbi:hypothetical protein C8F04DRAFT_1345853 [Mycena alexandri]|uniref:Uncharacterized protein n=1 Tax=Mycena alexandri TaxID=1745969 RepID=A0AAD6SWS0_9AGAR|nr:hypothetical protein C8F04DRAFT_1345853 [Mycena alexandri]